MLKRTSLFFFIGKILLCTTILPIIIPVCSQADLITFSFHGNITYTEDTTTDQLLNGTGIEAGVSTFTGSLTYDPSADPYWIPQQDTAWYNVGKYSITIDGQYSFILPDYVIAIKNDTESPPYDTMQMAMEHGDALFDIPIERKQMEFGLWDWSAEVFPDTSLPDNINLSLFDDGRIRISGAEDAMNEYHYYIEGSIIGTRDNPGHLVPTPSAVFLMAPVFMTYFVFRRKKN
jgi:hypothetical protein